RVRLWMYPVSMSYTLPRRGTLCGSADRRRSCRGRPPEKNLRRARFVLSPDRISRSPIFLEESARTTDVLPIGPRYSVGHQTDRHGLSAGSLPLSRLTHGRTPGDKNKSQ